MLEDVTAMLHQAKLPPSFWGRCLATQVKVWNCLPTSALLGKTPHEAWYSKKPDLSRFRVFGCTAYVFVQKDKRKKLESHMRKCLFVGYPSDYKGWNFYDPTTKQFFVSERAEFDEHYFPGLRMKNSIDHTLLHLLGQPPTAPIPSGAPAASPEVPDDVELPQMPVHLPPHIEPPPAPRGASPVPVPLLNLPAPQPPAPAPAQLRGASPAPQPVRRTGRQSKQPGEWWKVAKPV